MAHGLKAVIFDMDGVLINSEPLWRRAMIKGFTGAGIHFTEEHCRKTTGLRINEVIEFWLKQNKHLVIEAQYLENEIVEELIHLIETEGDFIPGIPAILNTCSNHGLITGLATSSSNRLMKCVLNKLNLNTFFKATVSAEFLTYGKPHPEVFLNCAQKLACQPQHCLVIEDSLNGVIAARAAQMQVIAVPDEEHSKLPGYLVAHYLCYNMTEAGALIQKLTSAT